MTVGIYSESQKRYILIVDNTSDTPEEVLWNATHNDGGLADYEDLSDLTAEVM